MTSSRVTCASPRPSERRSDEDPVYWLREYVDLPDDVSTPELARRLTALGLKLESLERPGHDITGPLVIGRVLTVEAEPQKNGKTINWCTVDVGAANGTGEPQGIVCGAHNFGVGDLVVVVLPGGVLPGPFEISARKTYGHVSAGMICSSKELGLGDDHDGIIVLPADAGEPGDDVFELLQLRDEVIEFEINPDRAYALSLRGVAREAALALGDVSAFHDPADRDVPAPNADGYPVEVEDAAGCPVFAARTVTGFDPAAPTPTWLARRLHLAGMRSISLAVDVTNYVMLELGQPIHGYDGDKLSGPIRVRRATEGEKLTTLDDVKRTLSAEDLVIIDDSGPIGLAGVMGGATTEMSETTTHIVIEAAHWDAVSMFRTGKRHKLSSEAGKRNERGVDPTLPAVAADRVVELLTTYGGGTAAPRRHAGRHRPAGRADPDRPRPARPDRRSRDRRRHRHRLAGGDRRRRRRRRPRHRGHPAAVASRPHRPLRPGRGGRPAGRLRPDPVGAADRTSRTRPDPRPEAAPSRRADAGRRGVRRGDHVPVHR